MDILVAFWGVKKRPELCICYRRQFSLLLLVAHCSCYCFVHNLCTSWCLLKIQPLFHWLPSIKVAFLFRRIICKMTFDSVFLRLPVECVHFTYVNMHARYARHNLILKTGSLLHSISVTMPLANSWVASMWLLIDSCVGDVKKGYNPSYPTLNRDTNY